MRMLKWLRIWLHFFRSTVHSLGNKFAPYPPPAIRSSITVRCWAPLKSVPRTTTLSAPITIFRPRIPSAVHSSATNQAQARRTPTTIRPSAPQPAIPSRRLLKRIRSAQPSLTQRASDSTASRREAQPVPPPTIPPRPTNRSVYIRHSTLPKSLSRARITSCLTAALPPPLLKQTIGIHSSFMTMLFGPRESIPSKSGEILSGISSMCSRTRFQEESLTIRVGKVLFITAALNPTPLWAPLQPVLLSRTVHHAQPAENSAAPARPASPRTFLALSPRM